LIELSNGTDTNDYFRLAMDSSNRILAQTNAAGSGSASTTTATVTDANWHDAIAIFGASGASRFAGFDGTLATENTLSRVPSGIDHTRIALNIANNNDFVGLVGYVAMWNTALTSGEYSSLHAGVIPPAIQRASLLRYYPITDSSSPGTDIISGANLTLLGNAAYNSDNPSVSGLASKVCQY
jgi:hypothetical protein